MAERRRQRVFETAEPEPEGSTPSRRRPPASGGGPTDAFPIGPSAASRIGRARGGGSPLPEAQRTSLEGLTGRDLGAVRIHTGAEADHLARGIGATAFASGSDVFFKAGRFAPSTSAGGALLEHEIGHVVGPAAAPNVVLRDDDDDDDGGGFGGEDETAKPPAKDPAILEDEFPDDPKGARQEAVNRVRDKMNEALAASDPLEGARLERQLLLLMYTHQDDFFSVQGVEEYVVACAEDSKDEATVLRKLGPYSNWSLVITPQAFPATWSELVKRQLDLGVDGAMLQAEAKQAWDNLVSWANQVPPYVVQNGLPVEFAQALALDKFDLGSKMNQDDTGDATLQYLAAAKRYRFTAFKAGFVAGWQQFVITLSADVKAGLVVVNQTQIDEISGASSKLGEMAKAAGPPDADGYRELDTEMVNLQQAGFFVFLLSFLQSMSDSASLWKKAVDLFDQKMAEADTTIKGTGNIDNIGHGFWWAFYHGYFQGAVVATAMAIYEHKGEVFAKLVALGAILAVAQDTPIGWIADLFGGLVIIEGVGSLLLAFKRVGGSNYVTTLQKHSAELAQEMASAIANGVLAYVVGKGIEATAEAIRVRMEKFKARGATEREAGRKAMEEPEEPGVGVSQPVEITDAARGAPSTKGKDAVAKAQKDELALKEEAADIADAVKGAPKVPKWTLVELIREAKYWAERGMGKWIQRAQVEGRIHVMSKEEMVGTFGEAVGEQLWSDVSPGTRGMHYQGHVFVKRGLELQSAASTLVHEITHLIQRGRISPFQATFESEFQALSMQKRYLRQLPPKDVPEDVRWLYEADSSDIADKILERYGTYKPINEADVDALIKQVTDEYGSI